MIQTATHLKPNSSARQRVLILIDKVVKYMDFYRYSPVEVLIAVHKLASTLRENLLVNEGKLSSVLEGFMETIHKNINEMQEKRAALQIRDADQIKEMEVLQDLLESVEEHINKFKQQYDESKTQGAFLFK